MLVFVVEDDRNLLAFCLHVLSGRHRVQGFACGRAALKALKRTPPEALVSDLDLPRVSGEELAEAAAALPGAPVVVLVSGDRDRLQRARGLAHVTLGKPFSPKELMLALEPSAESARLWKKPGIPS